MKLYFDEKSDTLYLRLDSSNIIESEEIRPGIVLDYNTQKQVVGIEILHMKAYAPKADLKQIEFKVA